MTLSVVTVAAVFPVISSMGPPSSTDPAAGNCTENTCESGCVCLPKWKPTWSMARSTILYVDQPNGFHNVSEAVRWGVVAYDWSNAKALWANEQPMNCDELLTRQAEMVQAVDPGVPGEQPRVWVYRNTAKALNFYASVREKLDDPAYAGWFVRYDPSRYRGAASNASFVSPPCDWYYNSTYVPKCSRHYHDQTDCPHAEGGGPAYPKGGPPSTCREMCDCGSNPCGEYTFNFLNESFQEWFIHGYMISNATLYHKPHPIGLGWMDDRITMQGMSEEGARANFTQDTGLSATQMTELVAAYKATMARFNAAVVAEGGFTWMLMKGKVPRVRPTFNRHTGKNVTVNTSACIEILRESCVPHPLAWREATLYLIQMPWEVLEQGDQVTAEFLLTRGDYAWVGWGWSGTKHNPRAKEFDVDYGGKAEAPCVESETPGVFTREYPKATVTWDCHVGRGSIHMRQGQPETTAA
eukprot:COSAG06_NODE_1390_length_9607_cov_16.483172_5_plen_468_part_00